MIEDMPLAERLRLCEAELLIARSMIRQLSAVHATQQRLIAELLAAKGTERCEH